MRVVVTGSAGFVGRRVVAELLRNPVLDGVRIDELVLVDRSSASVDSQSGIDVRFVTGDLRDPSIREEIFREKVDGVLYLAAMMTADAERDFDGGIAFNLYGFHDFLEACRRHGNVRLVFASPNAAFGGALPPTVTDETVQRPQSSYGVQKVICELLIDDYTRRGFVDGRGLRLPSVLLRPSGGVPTISTRMSAIVCEPLAGRSAVCPFTADTRIPVASPGAVARGLVRLYNMPNEAIGPVRTMNFTALSVTIGDMIAALERRIGTKAKELIEWKLDEPLNRLVQSLATGMISDRGRAAGIVADTDFDAIIDDYLG